MIEKKECYVSEVIEDVGEERARGQGERQKW
jgi:hypothetical protein